MCILIKSRFFFYANENKFIFLTSLADKLQNKKINLGGNSVIFLM